MNLVFGHDQTVIDWLAVTYGLHVIQTPRVAMGVVDGAGVLRGAYVITWHTDTTAEWHLFGAVSHETIKAMFHAVFLQWRVHRLEIRTHRKNKKIKKAAPKFGFRFEGVARDFYGPRQDAFCYAMTAGECRWIKEVAHGLAVQVA